MLLQENILLNEYAVEWLVCKVLDTSERHMINNVIMSNIISILNTEALLKSNKSNHEALTANSILLKRAFDNCTTLDIQSDSVFPTLLYVAHNNLNYAKLLMHFVQFRCKQLNQRVLDMDVLMNQVIHYKTWHQSTLKQIWESQIIDNITVSSEFLVDYISASGSIQFDTP